jgi:hypothetical protein
MNVSVLTASFGLQKTDGPRMAWQTTVCAIWSSAGHGSAALKCARSEVMMSTVREESSLHLPPAMEPLEVTFESELPLHVHTNELIDT